MTETTPASSPAQQEYIGPYERWTFGDGNVYGGYSSTAETLSMVGVGNSGDIPFSLGSQTMQVMVTDPYSAVQPGIFDATIATASPLERFDGPGLRFLPLIVSPGSSEMGGRALTSLMGIQEIQAAFSKVEALSSRFWLNGPEASMMAVDPAADDLEAADPPFEADDAAPPDEPGSAGGLTFRFNHPIPTAKVNIGYDPSWSPDPNRDRPSVRSSKKIVVVGVIDDGLPFAHGHFLDSKGKTRIDHIWMQAAAKADETRVAFGAELTGPEIDQLRDRHGRDEDAIYSDPEAFAVSNDTDTGRNIFRTYTHGAHVMDTAAGFWPDDIGYKDRDQVRVIGVQMRRTSLYDTSGFGKDTYILAAVHYILDRAERIAARYGQDDVEVLINISLGVSGGPKNGKALIEQALDEVGDIYASTPAPDGEQRIGSVCIALAAGNSFGARMNGATTVPKVGTSFETGWRIQPNDRTSSYLEIWLDGTKGVSVPDVFKALKLTVTSPQGKAVTLSTAPVDDGPHIEPIAIGGGGPIGQLSIDRSGDLVRYMVVLAPTEYDRQPGEAALPLAPAGLWTIRLERQAVDLPVLSDTGRVRFQIQRDEDPTGTRNGGRQSYLDDLPGTDRLETHNAMGRKAEPPEGSFVTGYGSINGWATRNPDQGSAPSCRIAVGGFTGMRVGPGGKLGIAEPATYSAAGSRATDAEPKVDRSAASNRSHALPGMVGAGTRTGAHTVLVGTSSAAPAVIRSMVLDHLGKGTQVVAPNDPVMKVRLGKAQLVERLIVPVSSGK